MLLYLNSSLAFANFIRRKPLFLKVQNDILVSMDNKEITLLVLLDLSAAFDTTDHTILLDTLRDKNFGVVGSAQKWFESFLSARKQRILISGKLSADFNRSCGVPQGSCMVIPYVSRLFEVISKHLPSAHGYADDTQIYLSFKPDSHISQNNAIATIEN